MYNEEKPATTRLSKAVLDLKFMKKSKEKAELQEEDEEREKLYQDQLSSLHKGADRIVMVESYVDCMEFLPCRLSFGGMDPDIEKLNEERLSGVYKADKPKQIQKPVQQRNPEAMDEDVSAEDMIKYGGFLGNKAKELLKRKSDGHDFDIDEREDSKYFKGTTGRGQRSLFKANFNNREGGDFSNRGGGNYKHRGGTNFMNRGRGNFSNRGGKNFNNRGRGNFSNRSEANFSRNGEPDNAVKNEENFKVDEME